MEIVADLARLGFVLLTLLGFWVVALLTTEEFVPWCQLWWTDFQEGIARFRFIRRTRRIEQDGASLAIHVRWAVDLAKRRMTAATRRSQPMLGRSGNYLDEDFQ